ncbi:CRISPR-associated endoribonuclease Cas6 [Nocardiopsis mwathae]|uniref:CRISPR-associated endoribonuclease Cas6 n=1 Tax=Nocardiopsis mwathae TaxID=1472723 RepID=A0A7W9YNU6_9ACTN|nr:CRISPR-associated endoribonuclease Cas6 [Nocardiopsis mwathae]MBB6174931.1 CRISPR-associated endoribonuclease Cas6 [Nocardiopsis mwathae]
MRLQLTVRTTASSLPWEHVLKPGRGLVYELLARGAPELGARLHEEGWGDTGMVPFGHSSPVFPAAKRRRGSYAVGGVGLLEFGSPLLEVVEGLAKGLSEQTVMDWGGTALRVLSVDPVEPPEFESGIARLRTKTPVVMKGSGRDDEGVRTTRQAWLLPTEPEFAAYFENNLRRKALTLGLDPDVSVDAITWVGAKRSFAVGNGLYPGAPLEAELRGAPDTLRAVWSWGLGQANSAGFGWVAA